MLRITLSAMHWTGRTRCSPPPPDINRAREHLRAVFVADDRDLEADMKGAASHGFVLADNGLTRSRELKFSHAARAERRLNDDDSWESLPPVPGARRLSIRACKMSSIRRNKMQLDIQRFVGGVMAFGTVIDSQPVREAIAVRIPGSV